MAEITASVDSLGKCSSQLMALIKTVPDTKVGVKEGKNEVYCIVEAKMRGSEILYAQQHKFETRVPEQAADWRKP